MNCTSCAKGLLKPTFLEGQFRSHKCNNCHGDWVLIEDYVAWKERNPNYKFADSISFEENEVKDSKRALFCPVSGVMMRKFKLSASHEHRIDYSAAVGGIWLDDGEWELLKSEGLAGSLNSVVTQNWQKELQKETAKVNFEDIYVSKFGHDNYAKVKAFRTWLDSQDNKADLRAYIVGGSPRVTALVTATLAGLSFISSS
jgi:Zn-finger nucleic acid-binding protein